MKKYEGPSIKDVKTETGKLPANVGFPGNMSGPTNPEGIEGPPDEGVLRAKAHRQLLRNMGISQANIIHPNPPKK